MACSMACRPARHHPPGARAHVTPRRSPSEARAGTSPRSMLPAVRARGRSGVAMAGEEVGDGGHELGRGLELEQMARVPDGGCYSRWARSATASPMSCAMTWGASRSQSPSSAASRSGCAAIDTSWSADCRGCLVVRGSFRTVVGESLAPSSSPRPESRVRFDVQRWASIGSGSARLVPCCLLSSIPSSEGKGDVVG